MCYEKATQHNSRGRCSVARRDIRLRCVGTVARDSAVREGYGTQVKGKAVCCLGAVGEVLRAPLV